MKYITTALKLFAILTVLVGVIYPIEVTARRLIFPKEGGESLLYDPGGNLTGSPDMAAFFGCWQVKQGGHT